MIDHRAGAGLPEEVARLAGYDPAECRAGMIFESATITCSHCKQAYVKNKFRIRAREYCKKCDHYICDGCGKEAAEPNYVHLCGQEKLDKILDAKETGRTADFAKNPTIAVL